MAADEPPYLTVGTDVSAKYKGAFCEAKIKKVSRMVKCKVTFKNNLGTSLVTDDQLRGTLRVGAHVEAKHPEKNQYVEAVINKLLDYSQYTVVFDDGDETTLRRTSICLKSGRHFAESETLDQLPLTNPEHFGTPVMGSKSKRKRRSTINSTSIDDNSSDDEPPVKQPKLARERKKDPNFGKVVCYEIGDKRKKDSWLPCLVVSPTAQEHMKINSKEDYLIRSFKDGKYYQVPKKEAKEFTKEIGIKTESTTNKAAVDRAILYMEKDELPANWEKNVLMGLDVPSADEDSQESDSDTSDDEPSEEKDRFVAQLYKFMDERGTPINRAPTVGNRDLNLYKLFKIVHKMGGCNRVTNQNQWKTVHIKMGLPPPNSTSSNQIKSAYKRYLHSFEDFYRKLGCTMASTIRSSRARNRSERNFIMTRNRNRDIGTSKGRQDVKEKSLTQVLEEKIKMEEENREKANRSSTVIKTENEAAKPEDKMKEKEEGSRVRTREDKRREKADSPDKKEAAKSSLKTEIKDEEKIKKEPSKEKKEKTHKEKSDDKLCKDKRDEKSLKEKKEEKSFKEKKDEKPCKERDDKSKDKKDEKITKEKSVEKTLKEKKEDKVLKEKKEDKEKKDDKLPKGMKDDKPLKEKKDEKASKEKKDDKSSKEKKDDKISKEKKDDKSSKEKKDDKMAKEKKDDKLSKEKKDEKLIKEEKLSKDKKDEKPFKEKKDGKESSISEKSDNQSKIKSEDSSFHKKQIKKKTVPSDKTQAEQKKSQDSEQEHKDTNRDDEDIEMGDRVRVRYGRGRVHKIYEAKVIKIDKESGDRKFYVHYTGWNTRYDEWVKKGRIVENISERNVNARKKKLGLSLKNTNGKIPGKRGRPPSSAKLTPPTGNSILVRKNSSSSISSTTSNSRTMRSDRNSLSESPFASGLEPRRRSRRKSGMSINNPETSQELEDSDLDHEESEIENLKENMQTEIKQETDDYKETYEEQKDIQTLSLVDCNISNIADEQKCLTDDDVEQKDVLDIQDVAVEVKKEVEESPIVKLEITEDSDIKQEEDKLASDNSSTDNSDEIKEEINDTVKSEPFSTEDCDNEITMANDNTDITAIKTEECKDETLKEELTEEHGCSLEPNTETEYINSEVNEICSEETLDLSLQETDAMGSRVISEETDDKESPKVLEEVSEEIKVEATDTDTLHTDSTVTKSEDLNEEENVVSTNVQVKEVDEIPQESAIICEETSALMPAKVESDVANDDSQQNDTIPVISNESNSCEFDDVKMDEVKYMKEEITLVEETIEQRPISEDLIEKVEEEMKKICKENAEEQRTKQEMEEVSQIIADMAETEIQIDLIKPENQEIEDSIDKPKLDSAITPKKEAKKKKSKGLKIDKKSSGDNVSREEGRPKDGKSKSKKKYKLENDDGEKCKEFEGKLKSKKLKEKDKKNKIKKRSEKSETCGENDTKQGDSKDELCEKLKKKKKDDKKSKSEFIEGKTSDIKKEKKKGKKNKDKLTGEKKEGSIEKKSKKKKKVHVDVDGMESDSEKEGSSKVEGDKLKKKGKKKDKKKSKESAPSDDAGCKVQKEKKQEKKQKVEIIEETVAALPESFSVPKVEIEPEQDIAAFLFCEEKVPASPVATEEPTMHSSHISQMEDLVANSTPAALAASEVLARISESVVNPTLTYPKGINHILVTEAANRHESEVAAVLDNTPPTTPESTESALYSSPLAEREPYSLNDGESTHSGRESADGESDNLHIETTKLDVAESEDSLVFPPLSSSVSNVGTNKETCAKTSPTRKRHRDESEDFSQGKKKRKSSKKSHSSGISRKLSFSKSVKGETSLLESNSMDYRSATSPNFSLSTITQSSTPVDGSLPRPSKFNFYVSLDDYEDSNKRILAIQENLARIKKVYMGLKAEVAIIDRRRKKAKRKEKEAAAQSSATVSQPIEVQCSS